MLGILCLLTPVAAEGFVQKFSATMSPSKAGSRAHAKPVSLALRAWFDDLRPDLGAPLATARARVFLPRDVTTNSDVFPACARSTIAQDPNQCPSGSQLASGTALIRGLGLDEPLVVRIFNTAGTATNAASGQLTLLAEGASPLVIRELAVGQLTELGSGNPRYGRSLSFAFPRGLQSPGPGVMAGLADLAVTFPVQRYSRLDRVFVNGEQQTIGTETFSLIETNGCTGGVWSSLVSADYVTEPDGPTQSSQAVESQQRCSGPTGQPARRVPLADLRDVQVFFRGQAALGRAQTLGRILTLSLAKIPGGASVHVRCTRGCRFSTRRAASDIERAGGEVTWQLPKPLVVSRGSRILITVFQGARTARLTVAFKRRHNELLPRIVKRS